MVSVPPASLVANCYVSPPPTAEELLTALDKYPQIRNPLVEELLKARPDLLEHIEDGWKWQARFLLMETHRQRQTDALGNCNKQLTQLRRWREKQTTLEKSYDARGGAN